MITEKICPKKHSEAVPADFADSSSDSGEDSKAKDLVQPLKAVKGYLFKSDILDAYLAEGSYQELYAECSPTTRISRRTLLITHPTMDCTLLKCFTCPTANTAELARTKQEYDDALKLSQQNAGVDRPLLFRKAEDSLDTNVEVSFAHPGKELSTRIKVAQADEIIEIARRTLDPLAFLERNGIFRPRLAPSSILVKDGRYMVVDLGVASNAAATVKLGREAAPAPKSIEVGGQPDMYSGPEFFSGGELNMPDKADVYRWGMIMYELASKKSREKLEKESKKYKKDAKKYEGFLNRVCMMELPGDTNGYLTDLFIPILAKTLAFKPTERPSFGMLYKLMGESAPAQIVSPAVSPVKAEDGTDERVSKLKAKLAKAKKKAEVLKTTVDTQKRLLDANAEAVEKLKRKLEKAKNRLAAVVPDSSDSAGLLQLKAQVQSLAQELEQWKSKLQKKKQRVTALKSELSKLQAAKGAAPSDEITAEMKEELQKKSEEIADLRTQLKNTERDLAELRKENYALKNSAQRDGEDIDSLQKSLHAKEAQVANLQSELSDAKDQIKRLAGAKVKSEAAPAAAPATTSPYRNRGVVSTFGEIKDLFVTMLARTEAECGHEIRQKVREYAKQIIDQSSPGYSALGEIMGNSGAATIALSLRCAPAVQILDLGFCGIGTEGGVALGEAIRNHWSLRGLFLGYEAQVKAKRRKNAGDPQFQLIKLLSGSGSKLKRGQLIPDTLDLAVKNWNRIGLAGVRSIAQALKSNTVLAVLDLSYTAIGNAEVYELIEGVNANSALKRLYLYKNDGITDKSGRSYGFRPGVKVVCAVC